MEILSITLTYFRYLKFLRIKLENRNDLGSTWKSCQIYLKTYQRSHKDHYQNQIQMPCHQNFLQYDRKAAEMEYLKGQENLLIMNCHWSVIEALYYGNKNKVYFNTKLMVKKGVPKKKFGKFGKVI